MPEHEARRRAVYDHADEEPRPAGRRRRQVADWGVGEELFDGMPGARFDRRGTEHTPPRPGSIPRGGASDGRRTIVIAEDDVRVEDEAPAEEFASRKDALDARRRHDAVWAGDEPFADDVPAANPFAAAAAAFESGGRFAEEPTRSRPGAEPDEVGGRRGAGPDPEEIVRGGVEGRRTVKIGGRPAEFHPTPARRPARMVHERLGPRPDRIAAWAFALGILLILIAIATASI